MLLHSTLPEPVYVAVVKSITGLLPSKLIGIIVVLAQAIYLSYCLGDTAIALATTFTAVAAVPRIAVLAAWNRRRDAISDGPAAARWEAILVVANLPTAFGIGLIAAATIAHGNAEWSMVEVAVAVGFVSTYIASAGVRPTVGTAHFVAVMGPGVLACLSRNQIPYILLAGLSTLLVQTWREYQRASYNALVRQIALEQAAAKSARTDPLTKLGNRLAFAERLRDLDAKHVSYSLVLLDLDGFKSINDNWGHAAGDDVLGEIAARMRRRLTSEASIFRLGGDEFAVLSSSARTQSLATALIEDCREPIRRGRHFFHVGVSIGIASGPSLQIERRADEALYAAKAAGKNCWRIATAVNLAA